MIVNVRGPRRLIVANTCYSVHAHDYHGGQMDCRCFQTLFLWNLSVTDKDKTEVHEICIVKVCTREAVLTPRVWFRPFLRATCGGRKSFAFIPCCFITRGPGATIRGFLPHELDETSLRADFADQRSHRWGEAVNPIAAARRFWKSIRPNEPSVGVQRPPVRAGGRPCRDPLAGTLIPARSESELTRPGWRQISAGDSSIDHAVLGSPMEWNARAGNSATVLHRNLFGRISA
jgi:hypothetical protein